MLKQNSAIVPVETSVSQSAKKDFHCAVAIIINAPF
jgi:hypothetical protein